MAEQAAPLETTCANKKEKTVDPTHFDAVTRTLSHLPSRRDLLRGLARALASGGLAALVGWPRAGSDVEAKKKGGKKGKKKKTKKANPAAACTPRCGRKVCGDDGCGGSCGSCAAGQFCASGTCCTPEPVEETCAMDCGYTGCPARCDTVRSPGACGPVACTCPSGQQCLGNSSCARTCDPNTQGCPSRCRCDISTEGAGHCYHGSYCSDNPQVCTSSAECPLGHACQKTMCGPGPVGSPENRCWPLCGYYGLD